MVSVGCGWLFLWELVVVSGFSMAVGAVIAGSSYGSWCYFWRLDDR